MADGVTYVAGQNATPPDGTKAATDDLGAAGHAGIAKLAVSADGDATRVPADADGLYVQAVDRAESPQHSVFVAAAVVPGGGSVLDAADVTAGKTGRLVGVDCGASVPIRVDVETVDGARVIRSSIYLAAGDSREWRPPSSRFLELAGGAGVRFGATVTNLSPHLTADARVTIYWDEVT